MNHDHFPKKTDSITVGTVLFTHGDIQAVVQDFYTVIQFDPLLEVPFRSVHNWPEHIERLTHFWWVRLGGTPYLFGSYNPVQKHFFAGFNDELLARWLELFNQTLKKQLNSDQSSLWAHLAARMGESLSIRNEFMKKEYESKKGNDS